MRILPDINRPADAENNSGEVVFLKSELFWALFRDTGDPLCYLLYRAALTEETDESAEAAGEAVRRPA